MSKIDELTDCMQELAALGPSFAAAVQRASGGPSEFIQDANRLLQQLSGDPSAGAVQAMRDAPRDLVATASFVNRWRGQRQAPGVSEVLRCAEATERSLQRFNTVLESLSPTERAEAERVAQFGRAALGALRPPRHPFAFGLGIGIFGIGVVAGIIFAFVVGPGSPEFQQYFPAFLAVYAVGIVLVFLGK